MANLKYLYIEQLSSDRLEGDFLTNFKQLKEIQFICGDFVELKRQKQFYELSQLKINYFGVELDSLNQYLEFLPNLPTDCILDDQLFKFYIRHCSNLPDRLPFVNAIEFNKIECLLTRMPNKFYGKLFNFSEIAFTGRVIDESSFDELVRKLNGKIAFLRFDGCCLSQAFFDRLSNHSHCIQTLILGRNLCRTEINLEFVLELKNLTTLRIEQEVTDQIVKRIEEHLQSLNYFSFYLDGVLKSIQR